MHAPESFKISWSGSPAKFKIEDLLSQLSIVSDGNLNKRKYNEPNHCDRAQININLDNHTMTAV
jgi:hypothetical protein